MNMHEFGRRLDGFDIEQEIVDTITYVGDEAANLVRGQMSIGLSGNGKQIRNRFTKKTDYSVYWGEYRLSKNLQVDYFDLRVTGEFTNQIQVYDVTPKSYRIDSPSFKTHDLVDMFGEDILKMTDESTNIFIKESFYPDLRFRIETKLGVKFGS